MLLLVSVSLAATLTVATDGSGTHTTLSAAVAAAADGDTILLAPGDWYETVSIDARRLTIRSIEGAARTTIVGSGLAAIRVNASSVAFEGLTVENPEGRGLVVAGSATVSVADSVFASFQGSADGAAAHVESGALYVSGTTFDGNVGGNGGAIAVATGELDIDACTFTNNEASYNGGAIYAGAYTSIRVKDSTFTANSNGAGGASQAGGALYVGNYATLGVEGSTFQGNGSPDYDTLGTYGGAVYLGQVASAEVVDSDFDANIAYYGGAFFQDYYGNLALQGGSYTSNYAYYGGVGFGRYIGELSLANVAVLESTSLYNGAGFYVEGASRIRVTGSTFDEGYATYGYAAAMILYYVGELEITDTVLSDNVSYYDAGALYLYSITSARLSGVAATDNVATYGSGGVILGYYMADLEVAASTFSGNAAAGHGGAIYAAYGGFSADGSTFSRNVAEARAGGAVYAYADGYDVSVKGTTFADNRAGGDGGGLAVDGGALTLLDTAFIGGEAGVSGGGLYAAGATSRVVRRVVASGNTAQYGGGAYVAGAARPDEWGNWVLADNEAGYGGGAAFVETDMTNLVNGVLLSNAATELGAGLYLFDGTFDVRNAAVAWSSGSAAIYAESADITAAYDAFWENPEGNTHGFAATDSISAAPGFVGYAADGDATDDSFALWRTSPLVDAGDPAVLDADGSRSDIGVQGGAWFVPQDADGDGATTTTDCDDAEPGTLPGAADTWYDGVDADCDGASDYDQDGDGLDAADHGGADCDDLDATVGECPGEDTAPPDTDADSAEDTAPSDTDTDTDAADAPGDGTTPDGCGCSAAPVPASATAWVGLVALAGLRRRVRDGALGSR